MRSDNKHIDQFFRDKEKEASTDLSHMEQDWQHMKEWLSLSSSPAATVPLIYSRSRKYIAYAAAILLLLALSVVTLNRNKVTNKKDITARNSGSGKEKRNTPITPLITDTAIESNDPAPATITPTIARKKTTINDPADYTSKKQPGRVVKQLPGIETPVVTPLINKEADLATKEAEAKKLFAGFYAQLEKPAQEFVINNQADTTIVCAEGTVVFIPAGSFQSLSGTALSAVTVSVREFYQFADIIGQKLTTVSDGQALETGGMINIEAVANAMPVMIKPGKTLGLKMPTQSFKHNMQLFTGEGRDVKNTVSASTTTNRDTIAAMPVDAGINWISRGQRQTFFANNKKIVTIFNTMDNPYSIENYRNNTKTIARFAIPYSASISTEDMREILMEKYGKYYDRIKVKRAWRTWVDRNRTYRYSPTEKKEKDRITNVWYESGFVGDSITIPLSFATRFKLITVEDSLAWEAKFKQQLEDAIRYNRSYQEFLEKKNEYSFTISNLGWINCDRFLDYPKSRLTAFTVNPGDGFHGAYMHAIMVFQKEKSAMPGYWINGKLSFPNIPVGHRVTVICAGVRDGKMYTAVQPFIISKQEASNLVFENSSPEDFRKKLSDLGGVN